MKVCIASKCESYVASNVFTKSVLVEKYRMTKVIGMRYEKRFDELRIIGEGGFGKVYKVSDKLDKQIYAIKVITFKGIQYFYQLRV